MELVTGATHRHSDHGEVRIETIYREYSVYDDVAGDGSIQGGWYVAYSPLDGGDTHIDPVDTFIESI